MSKRIRESEFKCYLMDLDFNELGQSPFIDNFLASDFLSGDKSIFSFLLFLKLSMESYKRRIEHGELSFQEFLNNLHPPVALVDKTALQVLKNYLTENYNKNDKLSVKQILDIIDSYGPIKNHLEG